MSSVLVQERSSSFISSIISALLPFMIVGGLLYLAFFVKAESGVVKVISPPLERRDVFYGMTIPAPDVIWAVGSNGKIVRSVNDGETWAAQVSPLSSHIQSISAWDERQAIAVGNQGRIAVTSDGGTHWVEVEAPHSEVANKLLRVRVYGDGVAWAVGELGAVLRTNDYGKTWQRAVAEKDQAWNDVFFIGNQGWVVGEFGAMLKTADGGATWNALSSPVKSSLLSVYFRDANNGVAVGLAGVVLRTSDGGNKWTLVKPATKEHLNSVIWDGSHWIAVGDKGIMISSDMGGEDWRGGRIDDKDLSWHTQIIFAQDKYYLAGANLSELKQGALHVFGRN